MNVAVDAMGGDNAPEVVVQGAVEANSKWGIGVILVGDEIQLRVELEKLGAVEKISIQRAENVVEMGEPPLKAIRKKKNSSIRVSFDLVKTGEADAMVSAGNSGATVATAILTLGRMRGIDRPAIASVFPGYEKPVLLIDVGANVDCRPEHLFQFGAMACAFANSCLGFQHPKIGLLSIGEEGTKGNEQVRLARELFEESELNFAGNVEGRDVFMGNVDIVVCDGFVGNVVLKLSEGMADSMKATLRKELSSSAFGKLGAVLARQNLKKFDTRLDYEKYGGAPLLGINGVSIICHGNSSARAIGNAIRLAANYAEMGMVKKMYTELNEMGLK